MHTLVIGIGNRLRGDDGIGPAVADEIASWNLPGVKAIAVHQLVPELVAELEQAARVLFVDAAVDLRDQSYAWKQVETALSPHPLGHHDTPENLLALTRDMMGRCPDAWLLAIAIACTDIGETLSPTAQRNIAAALPALRIWIERPARLSPDTPGERGRG
jgi:hydrogenase maturation protease